MHNRIEEIKNAGAAASESLQSQGARVDYSKIKAGTKVLDDAIFKLGALKSTNPRLADKANVLRAINENDLKTMREISDFFYRISGIYARLIRYMAYMYRYDYYVTSIVNDKSVKKEKIMDGFNGALSTLEGFGVKKQLGDIAFKIMRYGVYYGYKVPFKNSYVLQDLPVNYCRNRFNCGNKPAVEFNMRFFDDYFRDTQQKLAMIKLFPPEFEKGYALYKKGKLPPEYAGDTSGWYLLDPESTVKFTANGEEYPAFISVIPLLIDLDEAQALDKKKTLQRLLKIVIQKMPLDDNGDLILDPDEAAQLHNNAVAMLSRAIGVDVLTTFADVEVANLDASTATSQQDDLLRVERQVYNEAGVSQMQFNTDGNIALEKSILNDEATLYSMILQFEDFLNELIDSYNKGKKKVEYEVQILPTTVYNYKELSKLYKEQMQVGFSKMLPQIALGQSQRSILATAYFENDILDLVNVFIPPLMSSTMNENILNRVKGGGNGDSKTPQGSAPKVPGEQKSAGRKELADDQKSEKTIKNRESQS